MSHNDWFIPEDEDSSRSKVPSDPFVESVDRPLPSLQPTRSPAPPALDGVYNLKSAVFQAEHLHFHVLRQGFMTPGTKFADILSDPTNAEGKSFENPIPLDITAKDFRAFLRVLYPFWNFGSYENQSMDIDYWISVHRLAKEWKFTKVREQAITELTRLLDGKFRDMIRLGQELSVETWLRQGLIGLATEICKGDLKPAGVIGPSQLFVKDEWAQVANLFYLCHKVSTVKPLEGYVTCCGHHIGPSYSTLVCGSCRRFWKHEPLVKLVDEVFSVDLETVRNNSRG